MSIIRTLALSITARTSGLATGLKSASRMFAGFEKRIKRTFGVLGGGGGLFGVLAGVGATAAIGQAIRQADELVNTSQRLGIAHDRLRALQHAAKLANVDVEALNEGLVRMAKSVSAAAAGAGAAKQTFKELQLDPQKLRLESLDEQFLDIAEAISKTKNVADKLRFTTEIFGKGGAALGNLLGQGRGGIEQSVALADRLGISLKNVPVDQIEAAGDALENVRAQLGALTITFLTKLVPLVIPILEKINDALTQTGKIAEFVRTSFLKLSIASLETGNPIGDVLGLNAALKLAGISARDLRAALADPGLRLDVPPAALDRPKLPAFPTPDEEDGQERSAKGLQRFVHGEISPFVDPGALSRGTRSPLSVQSPQLARIEELIARYANQIVLALRASRILP